MAASEMKELLTHELGDLLYAERLILKMLGTLTREVKNPEMLSRVQEHIGETEEQIERLGRAFESIGEKAKAEKCDAAIGLKEEHDSFKKDEKPSKAMLEAFDLGSSLRVEHYEIAGYRSAIAVATALGERECVALLSESLREEEAMATFIERNSVKTLKGLAAGMDLASGAAEVVLKTDGGTSSRGRSGSKSSGGTSSGSGSRSSASRSNGRGATSEGGSSSSSNGKSAAKSTASKSTGGKSSGSKPTASKSSGGKSASKSSGSSSSRATAERSSGGTSSGRSKSGGASSSKSGGSKSGGSRSGSSRSGSSARA